MSYVRHATLMCAFCTRAWNVDGEQATELSRDQLLPMLCEYENSLIQATKSEVRTCIIIIIIMWQAWRHGSIWRRHRYINSYYSIRAFVCTILYFEYATRTIVCLPNHSAQRKIYYFQRNSNVDIVVVDTKKRCAALSYAGRWLLSFYRRHCCSCCCCCGKNSWSIEWCAVACFASSRTNNSNLNFDL